MPRPSFLLRAARPPVWCSRGRAREVLDVVANRRPFGVVDTLGADPKRFGDLKCAIEGISQKMLTVNLRNLERNGILTRPVIAVMPPNVTCEIAATGGRSSMRRILSPMELSEHFGRLMRRARSSTAEQANYHS
jgi:DNA-binding HxlR family transcriptional regulator